MFRKAAVKNKRHKDPIKWRGHEVTRIEAFSDAVLAFAVTLLIVALEVPETYDELMHVMKMFFPFAISFLLLFGIWNSQNVFFRRYGLHDNTTIKLNGVLLFTTLFFVYPVKFLFSSWLGGHVLFRNITEFRNLFMIYTGGFAMIYLLFALMYHNAYKRRTELQLTEAEIFETRTHVGRYFFIACGGLTAMAMTLLPGNLAVFAGLGFCVIGPFLFAWTNKRSKEFKARFPHVHREDILPEEEPIAEVMNSETLN